MNVLPCRLLALSIACLILSVPGVALSQTGTPPANAPRDDKKAVELSPTPIAIEDLGVSMRLPEGVKVTMKRQEAQRMIVETPDQTWIATLEVLQTDSDEETIKTVMDRLIEQTRTYDKNMNLKTRQTLTVDGKPVEYAVTRLEVASKNTMLSETRIYAIFSPTAKTFAIYGVRGDGLLTDKIAAMTRSTVDSFHFEDPAKRAAEVARGLAATQMAFDSLSRDGFERLLEPESWYRVYRKDESGQTTEIAYYRVQESTGPRAGVGERANMPNLTPTEAEQGVIVNQIARYVTPSDAPNPGFVIEIQNISWSSFDRKREQWSTSQMIYEPARNGYYLVSRSTISGVRENGKINVVVTIPDSNAPNPMFTEPAGYISQAERHLLYRILNPGNPGTYYMYQFRPQTLDIKRRQEVITATNDADRFEVRSTQDALEEPTVKTISAQGKLRRMIEPDGQITEPSSPEEIQRLWRLAGLPTSSITVVPRPGSGVGDRGRQ